MQTEVHAPRKEHLMSMDQNECTLGRTSFLFTAPGRSGSSWSSVIEFRQAYGDHVTAPQFPVTSLSG